MTDHRDDELRPIVLTEQHVGALERAIRGEGYKVMIDPATGEVTLEKSEL